MTAPVEGMRLFACTKSVHAVPIVAVDAVTRTLLVEMMDGTHAVETCRASLFADRMPAVGDYLVVYADGYRSISPAAPFLAGYVEAPLRIDLQLTAVELAEFRAHWESLKRDGCVLEAGIMQARPTA